MNRTRRLALLVVLTLAVGLAPFAPAGAQQGAKWAVEPAGPDGPGLRPNFAYNLAPGQSIRDSVSVSNLSEEPITFAIYAKDAYNTPRDAAFALQADEERATGVGAWITLGTNEYTVPGRTRVDVPFEVTVPENAQPGDHAGGIIAANVAPMEGGERDGVAVELRHRIAARVYVRVDGPMTPALRIDRIEVQRSMPVVPWLTGRGDATVTYHLTNVGNTRVDSVGTLRITGVLGRTVRVLPPETIPELLPGSTVAISQSWSGLPPVEPLTATLTAESIDGKLTVVRSQGFFVWSWAVVALVLLASALLGRRYWLRRRERRAMVEALAARGGGEGASVLAVDGQATDADVTEPHKEPVGS